MSKFLLLNRENLPATQSEVERQLSSLKIKERDILRAQLLLEELFLRMANHADIEQAKVQVVKNFFGKVQIQIIGEGSSCNPLLEVTDYDEETEDYYRAMILKANRKQLSWFRKQNNNVITIDIRGESNRQLWMTLAGMVVGLVCGFFMKGFFSPETISVFSDDIMSPINTMFFHALSLIIAPVIFFSIISGITNIGAGANVGKIGAKLVGLYLCTTIISALVTLPIATFLFKDNVPQVGAIGNGDAIQTVDFSWIKFITDIIPSNLVSPIVDGNLIQIIFIAVLVGISVNALADKAHPFKELLDILNAVFMKIMLLIIFFVPLIAFFAMINLVLKMGLDMLQMMFKIIIGLLLGGGAMLCVYMLIIFFVGKISPIPFLKKIPSLWPIPLATSSSNVTMPFTMDLCTKRLGISPKISSFSIPIGATINMDGGCVYLPVAVIMLLKMYGIDVTFDMLTIIFAMTVSLSIGTPGVPNAGVVCIITVAAMFGVPSDLAGFLFCIDTICDRIVTCHNVTGDVAATITLASTENMLDKKIYLAP